MKIGFVIKSLEPPGGGAERVLSEITRELASRGHEVSIATFDEPGGKPFYDFAVPIRGLGVSGSGLRSLPRRAAAIRRWFNQQRPGIVCGFMHSAYVPCILAGVPTIASDHTAYQHYRPLERALVRLAMRLSKAATVTSKSAQATFPSSLRLCVVPNPVRPVARRADPVGSGTKTILAIGQMVEEKNHELLIYSFADLAYDFPDWQLRIVGAGPLRQRLKKLVHSMGMVGRIFLPPPYAYAEQEYRGAQILAVPSIYESFGLVTAEGLSHGLPVIGLASCPGTNELVADGVNGRLVDPGKFRDVLRELMTDENQRVRLSTGMIEPERYSLSGVVDQWERVIAG